MLIELSIPQDSYFHVATESGKASERLRRLRRRSAGRRSTVTWTDRPVGGLRRDGSHEHTGPRDPVVPPQVRYDWTRSHGTRGFVVPPSKRNETRVRLDP